MHQLKSQIAEFEGVDVIIKHPSFAVYSNQTWGKTCSHSAVDGISILPF